MAKASSTTADRVEDYGVALDRSSQLDGFTVNFVTITKSHDLAPLLAALPTGKCTCPHWGYVIKGRLIVRYDDHRRSSGPATRSTCRPATHPRPRKAQSWSSSARPNSWPRSKQRSRPRLEPDDPSTVAAPPSLGLRKGLSDAHRRTGPKGWPPGR